MQIWLKKSEKSKKRESYCGPRGSLPLLCYNLRNLPHLTRHLNKSQDGASRLIIFLLKFLHHSLLNDPYPLHLHVCDFLKTPEWLLEWISPQLQRTITRQGNLGKIFAYRAGESKTLPQSCRQRCRPQNLDHACSFGHNTQESYLTSNDSDNLTELNAARYLFSMTELTARLQQSSLPGWDEKMSNFMVR